MSTDATAAGRGVLGPYQLEEVLGRGGMGEVYRAFDTRRGRMVALKILAPGLEQESDFRARFRRESDNAARLQDPHVIPIHDFGEIDGRLFIDMRLVEGTGLDQLIAAGPLPPRRAVLLIGQVAEALTDAHTHSVVHRDVKPSNILVTTAGFVYLVDFGIARALDGDNTALTRTGSTIGTLAYMAPERFDGGAPDHRSDIYSLAATLAECLTGRRPFQATNTPALINAHLSGNPPRPSLERPDVPPALDEVIARGMAKDPAARYATARDLAAAAQYALDEWAPPPSWGQGGAEPTRARSVATAVLTEDNPPPHRRSRLGGLTAAALLLAAVSGGTGYAFGRMGAGDDNPPAAGTRTAPAESTLVAAPAGPWSLPTAPGATSTAAAPMTVVPASARAATGKRPSAYRYSIDSNYPVNLVYIDSKGDQTNVTSAPAQWTATADTAAWGANAYPILVASSASSKGDTALTCTIADDQGAVLSTKTNAAAFASVSCSVYP